MRTKDSIHMPETIEQAIHLITEIDPTKYSKEHEQQYLLEDSNVIIPKYVDEDPYFIAREYEKRGYFVTYDFVRAMDDLQTFYLNTKNLHRDK